MKLDTCQINWSSLIKAKTERSAPLMSNRRKRSFPQNHTDTEPVRSEQSNYGPLPVDPSYDSQFYQSHCDGVQCGREITPDDHPARFTATHLHRPGIQRRCTRVVANDPFILQNMVTMQPSPVVSTQPPNPMSIVYSSNHGALQASPNVPASFIPHGFLEQLER